MQRFELRTELSDLKILVTAGPEQRDNANESILRQVNTMETPSIVPEHLQELRKNRTD